MANANIVKIWQDKTPLLSKFDIKIPIDFYKSCNITLSGIDAGILHKGDMKFDVNLTAEIDDTKKEKSIFNDKVEIHTEKEFDNPINGLTSIDVSGSLGIDIIPPVEGSVEVNCSYCDTEEIDPLAREMWGAAHAAMGIDNNKKCVSYNGDTQPAFVSGTNAGFVAVSGDKIILSFRGTYTAGNILDDVVSDINALGVTSLQKIIDIVVHYDNFPGRVHKGFYTAVESIISDITAHIKSLKSQNDNLKLYITGHSKGGAMATLAAVHLIANGIDYIQEVVVFASPRVGDSEFKNYYDSRNFKHTNYQSFFDIVPHLPLSTEELQALMLYKPITLPLLPLKIGIDFQSTKVTPEEEALINPICDWLKQNLDLNLSTQDFATILTSYVSVGTIKMFYCPHNGFFEFDNSRWNNKIISDVTNISSFIQILNSNPVSSLTKIFDKNKWSNLFKDFNYIHNSDYQNVF